MGWGMSRNLNLAIPHCFAISVPVVRKGAVTIETAGTPAFSRRIPSSTLPELHDPQSPIPAMAISAVFTHSSISAAVMG